jgi:hypothetical protein
MKYLNELQGLGIRIKPSKLGSLRVPEQCGRTQILRHKNFFYAPRIPPPLKGFLDRTCVNLRSARSTPTEPELSGAGQPE